MSRLIFVVKEVPKNPNQCPFSRWNPNPPILEESEYYECDLGGYCNIQNGRCDHLKSIGSYITAD